MYKVDKMIKMDKFIIDVEEISSVDLSKLESDYMITVITKQGVIATATELNAIECIMIIKPSALEGRRLKWAKRVWYIHNLIGHPLMTFLAIFKLYKAAMWIHDITVPKPIGFKTKKG